MHVKKKPCRAILFQPTNYRMTMTEWGKHDVKETSAEVRPAPTGHRGAASVSAVNLHSFWTLSPPLFPRSAVCLTRTSGRPQRRVTWLELRLGSPGSLRHVFSALPTQWSERHGQVEQARRWPSEEMGREEVAAAGEAWVMGPNFNEKPTANTWQCSYRCGWNSEEYGQNHDAVFFHWVTRGH